MKRIFRSLFIFIFFSLVASVHATPVSAQVFKFQLADPNQQIKVNDTFQVKILINTAGIQTINGDALFTFEPAKISLDSAVSGNFFTYFSANPLGGSTTKYLVSSWEESVGNAKSTSTDALFATLSLTAKAQGTTTLAFECTTGTESDSNINQASDSKDIIKCPLSPLTINIGGTGGVTNTPVPTATPPPGSSPTAGPTSSPVPTATPTVQVTPSPTSVPVPTATRGPTNTPVPTNTPRPQVSQLPRSGTTEVTIAALGIGTILTVVGILIIL